MNLLQIAPLTRVACMPPDVLRHWFDSHMDGRNIHNALRHARTTWPDRNHAVDAASVLYLVVREIP